MSLYYYFGVVRAIFWSPKTGDLSPIEISYPLKFAVYICIAGMLYLGISPDPMVTWSSQVVSGLKWQTPLTPYASGPHPPPDPGAPSK
jgi:NADH:ubiquinone oxidoreductase subunit 2 (subunit N)